MSVVPKRLLSRGLLSAALSLGLAALVAPAAATAAPGVRAAFPDPAVCTTTTAFLSQGGALYTQDVGRGSTEFTLVGERADYLYNAMGVNPADGYIYAISDRHTLVRVDPETGVATDLGETTPALPKPGEGINTINVGTFTADGRLAVTNSFSARLYLIHPTSKAVTEVPLSRSISASDLTVGPGGYLWGLTGSDAPVGHVARLDVTSGQVDFFPAPADLPFATNFGAAFAYGNGNIGVTYNGGGAYQLAIADPAGSAPSFSVIGTTTSPNSVGNDGTSCISSPVDLGVDIEAPRMVAAGGEVEWTLRVSNNGPGPSSGYALTSPVPAGYTDIEAPDGCTLAEGRMSCIDGVIAPNATDTLTVRAVAPSDTECRTTPVQVLGNEAEPTGDAFARNNQDSAETCLAMPSLTLGLQADVESAKTGDLVTFQYVIGNTGNVEVHRLDTIDLGFTGSSPLSARSCSSTTVQPGGSVTCTATYRVTEADARAGTIEHRAVAGGVTAYAQTPRSGEAQDAVQVLAAGPVDPTDPVDPEPTVPDSSGGSDDADPEPTHTVAGVLATTGIGTVAVTAAGALAALVAGAVALTVRRRRA